VCTQSRISEPGSPVRAAPTALDWLEPILGLMPVFVRVVHRQGWEVELVQAGQRVEKEILASREEALSLAESMAPDWIEVGDIVGLGTADQHHSWTTLRRGRDGSYAASDLHWGERSRS
jgi:hypothetical protein